MRWSLILLTFITIYVLSFVGVARAVPLSSNQLERRAPAGPKASSKTYRKNAQQHDYAYKFSPTGSVSRTKLKPEDREAYGNGALLLPNTDADHVYEVQLLNTHLKNNGLTFDGLSSQLQNKVKSIINGPENMAPVPAQVNRSKGNMMMNAISGKAVVPKKTRDDYTLLSYGTAKKTAQALDKAFEDDGYTFKTSTFHKALRHAMNNAKLMDPNQPSPAGSDAGSITGKSPGPRRSARIASIQAGGKKVTMPPRRSAHTVASARKQAADVRKGGSVTGKSPDPLRSAPIASKQAGGTKVTVPPRRSARISVASAKMQATDAGKGAKS